MLVSHRYRFIWLKTIKTAGTSVEIALQPYCLPEGAEAPLGACQAIETPAGIIGARGALDAVQGARWWNHMPAALIRDRLGPEVWDGYRRICTIRNPWDKTVSWFHFLHPQIKAKPPDTVVAAFRDWLRGAEGLGQDSQICLLNGRSAATHILRHETLQADFDRLCTTLGLAPAPLPRYKTDQRGSAPIAWPRYYDAEARATVAKAFAEQIGVFGWGFEKETA